VWVFVFICVKCNGRGCLSDLFHSHYHTGTQYSVLQSVPTRVMLMALFTWLLLSMVTELTKFFISACILAAVAFLLCVCMCDVPDKKHCQGKWQNHKRCWSKILSEVSGTSQDFAVVITSLPSMLWKSLLGISNDLQVVRISLSSNRQHWSNDNDDEWICRARHK